MTYNGVKFFFAVMIMNKRFTAVAFAFYVEEIVIVVMLIYIGLLKKVLLLNYSQASWRSV